VQFSTASSDMLVILPHYNSEDHNMTNKQTNKQKVNLD